jgi:hypothetical protein
MHSVFKGSSAVFTPLNQGVYKMAPSMCVWTRKPLHRLFYGARTLPVQNFHGRWSVFPWQRYGGPPLLVATVPAHDFNIHEMSFYVAHTHTPTHTHTSIHIHMAPVSAANDYPFMLHTHTHTPSHTHTWHR